MRAVLITAAACLPLAACGFSQAPGHASGPLTCSAQYRQWEHTPAARSFYGDARQLRQAVATRDLPLTLRIVRRIGTVAGQAEPMPRCADPQGLSVKAFAYWQAAGDNAATGNGIGAFELADGSIRRGEGVAKRLNAELNRTLPDR